MKLVGIENITTTKRKKKTWRKSIDHIGIYEPEDPDVSSNVRKQWIRSYVEAKHAYQGLGNDSIPDYVYDIADIKCSIVETVGPKWLRFI